MQEELLIPHVENPSNCTDISSAVHLNPVQYITADSKLQQYNLCSWFFFSLLHIQIRKDDFIEFDYTVLLHEIPTQVRKRMRYNSSFHNRETDIKIINDVYFYICSPGNYLVSHAPHLASWSPSESEILLFFRESEAWRWIWNGIWISCWDFGWKGSKFLRETVSFMYMD